MKYLLTIALACMLSTAAFSQKWTDLYNGKDLQGWAHVGEGKFVVENGMLKTEGGMGLLYYAQEPVENVAIRIVYRNLSEKHNAGVFIRIPEQPQDAWKPVHTGYEVQIDDQDDEYHHTGGLYSLTQVMAKAGRPGKWNTMEIWLEGGRTRVYVNKQLVTDYKEGDPVPPKKVDYEPERGPRPDKGYFGLQNHGANDTVYFKSVKLRKIGG